MPIAMRYGSGGYGASLNGNSGGGGSTPSEKYLIRDGRQEKGFILTGGYLTFNSNGYAGFNSGGNAVRIAYPNETIDLTDYTKLNITQGANGTSWSSTGIPSIGVFYGQPIVNASSGAFTGYTKYKVISLTTLTNQSLDLSDITGFGYVVMVVSGTSGGNGVIRVKDLWLSKD